MTSWCMEEYVSKVLQWLASGKRSFISSLNWLDLGAFCLGVLFVGGYFLLVWKRKGAAYKQKVATLCADYEQGIRAMKKAHIAEITSGEEKIQLVKRGLLEAQSELRDLLAEEKKGHAKRVQLLEKGHEKVHAADAISIYELRREMSRLRREQIDRVENFEREIGALKEDIQQSHEKHAAEMERAEWKISDLKKQMQALLYRA